jgi:aspartate/methionine/tyrosine aminotransferase
MLKKNPGIDGDLVSLPIVVPGISAGISYIADMFLDEDVGISVSDPCWDNYTLIFETRRAAKIMGVACITERGFDVDALRESITETAKRNVIGGRPQARLILNFPNNPSGYTPTSSEVQRLIDMIYECACNGIDLLVICDDAYFGFFYEDDIFKESLFGPLSRLHERVLAVKVDGPTKEDYVWGWRVAFVTFGSKGLKNEHYEALTKKMMGAIRSSVSCANTPMQVLLTKILTSEACDKEKTDYFDIMRRRYLEVKKSVARHGNSLVALPFNSGYFMCFKCPDIDAEVLRRNLLYKHGIGVVAFGRDFIRIAFSAIEKELIPQVIATVFQAADDLRRGH